MMTLSAYFADTVVLDDKYFLAVGFSLGTNGLRCYYHVHVTHTHEIRNSFTN